MPEIETAWYRLRAQYNEMLDTYKPTHPHMLRLQRDLEELERRVHLEARAVEKRLQSRLDTLREQEEGLQTAASTWRKELELSAKQRTELTRRITRVHHLEKLRKNISQRIIQGSLVVEDPISTHFVEPAQLLPDPLWPKPVAAISIGLLLGAGTGVGTAFLLGARRSTFEQIEAIERWLGIPFVSAVPLHHPAGDEAAKGERWGEGRRLVARDEPDTSLEGFRALRFGLETYIGDAEQYALMLTSCHEGEGKTTSAANLAILFAWMGRRVLLVDGDLRRGTCHEVVNCPKGPGLCELIKGRVGGWRELVHRTEWERLDFLPAGRYRADVPDLLGRVGLERLLTEWRHGYDLVIVDTAPIGRVSDTSAFARCADGVLLVVRHRRTDAGDVRHAVHCLAGANILGFSLNGVQMSRSERRDNTRWGGGYAEYAISAASAAYRREPEETEEEDADGDEESPGNASGKESPGQ